MIAKKPKIIVRTSAVQNRIIVRPGNPKSRYKIRSQTPPPGAVGHLQLTLRSM